MRVLTLALMVLTLAACHGSTASESTAPKSTEVNPGPNPTATDPGPNNTSNGPVTLQGKLKAGTNCVELDGNEAKKPAARFQLTFTGDTVKYKGANIVLSGRDGNRSVGPHDTVFVAGHPGAGTGPCGHHFDVEKIVAVTPAG